MIQKEIWSVKEVREVLIRMNNCKNVVKDVHFQDGTIGENDCCIDILCPECTDDFAALLEWAEDEGEIATGREVSA